jgi:hypothetical protein
MQVPHFLAQNRIGRRSLAQKKTLKPRGSVIRVSIGTPFD